MGSLYLFCSNHYLFSSKSPTHFQLFGSVYVYVLVLLLLLC